MFQLKSHNLAPILHNHWLIVYFEVNLAYAIFELLGYWYYHQTHCSYALVYWLVIPWLRSFILAVYSMPCLLLSRSSSTFTLKQTVCLRQPWFMST